MNIKLGKLVSRHSRNGTGPSPYWIDATICMQFEDVTRWRTGRPALGDESTVDAFTRALLDFLPRKRRIELLQQSLMEEMEGGGE